MHKPLLKQHLTEENATSLLAEKDQLIADQVVTINRKTDVIAEQKQRIAVLEEYLRLERARLYGRRSEKNEAQGALFDEAELCADESEENAAPSAPGPQPRKNAGRKGLSKSLPRHQVHLTLSDAEKAGAIDTFYSVVKEELDIEPATARVIEYLQEKAVFADPDGRRIKAATLPRHPLPKVVASIGLLAYVIVSKYADGLPLHRLETILKRYGGDISRTSMANWMIKLSVQLQPLINLLREHQLSYDYLHIDETRIKVLKEPGRSPTSDKWMWVTRGGPPDRPVTLFDYDPSRGKEVPLRLLDGYRGYLHSDGYAGYDAVCKHADVVPLGCWDHARRKFTDAKKAAPVARKNQRGKVARCDVALGKISALYAIEREIASLTPAEKAVQRQQRSQPALDELKQWLDNNIGKIPRGSKTHEAIQYTLNQWPKLIRYCEDGRLNISNALAENAIRPFVIGRNYPQYSVMESPMFCQ